jgi:uncharacterized protein DUF6492
MHCSAQGPRESAHNETIAGAYTIVTVAYAVDQPFIELQAESLKTHLEPDASFVREIVIVDNQDAFPLCKDKILSCYGSFASRVRFIDAVEFGDMPPDSGWYRQQALKLLISRKIETPRYILLDAKNHLINRVSRSTVESKDGKLMYSYVHSYREHTLRHLVENACRYFAIDERVIEQFMPTVTPFAISTQVARELLDYIEGQESRDFAQVFLARDESKRVTEFGLYAAYLIHSGRGFTRLYDLTGPKFRTIWGDVEYDLPRVLERAGNSAFFSVHRTAFRNLDSGAAGALADFWHKHKLFSSRRAAKAFVTSCARRY